MRNIWRTGLGLSLCLVTASMLSGPSTARAQFEVDAASVEKVNAALPESAPAKPAKPRRLLIFSKTNGFRHDSIPVGVKSMTLLGEKTGAFSVVHTEDDSYFEPERLKEFDAVLMLNTTGEIFQPKQLPDGDDGKAALEREERLKASLQDFVKSGKGLAGFHSATDTYHNWPAYTEMMGGTFDGHPWHEAVPVRLLDPDHPLNKVFKGEGFTITDEIYQFRNGTARPEDRRMLLSLDPTWKELARGNRKDGFYPISWIAKYGDGRTFYCSLGHRQEIYWNPVILQHYLAGLQYALGDIEVDATPISIPAK
ncbi:MAG: ThuA domain-containing protein [Pirellulales bacterium]